MKKINFLMATLTAITLGSCITDEIEIPKSEGNHENPQVIQISATMDTGAATRAGTALQSTALSFDASRKAGVYVYKNTKTAITDSYGYENNQVTALAADGTLTTTAMFYPQDGGAIDAYVYAPYVSTGASLAAMPFTINGNQSSDANYLASDFVFGKTANVSTGNAAEVTLNHALSKIIVNVTAGTGSPSLTGLSGIQLTGINTKATINMTTAFNNTRPYVNKSAVTSNTTGNVTVSSGTTTTAACIIPPQTTPAGAKISLTIDEATKTADINGQEFEPGKVYTIAVTLNLNAITVKVTSIEDWATGTTINKAITM